jgi:hypothetical protein
VDLAADLRKYTDKEAAKPLVDELSARTAKALQGRDLADQEAQRLAHNLWVSVYAKDLSERQVEALQNDTQALLTSLGVGEESAQQVAVQVGEVQNSVSNPNSQFPTPKPLTGTLGSWELGLGVVYRATAADFSTASHGRPGLPKCP